MRIASASGSGKINIEDFDAVGPNAPPIVLPPLNNFFLSASNEQLRQKIAEVSFNLRKLQEEISAMSMQTFGTNSRSMNSDKDKNTVFDENTKRWIEFSKQQEEKFKAEFLQDIYQIFGAVITRSGPVSIPAPSISDGLDAYKLARSIQRGSGCLRFGRMYGAPEPVADFLDFLATKLPGAMPFTNPPAASLPFPAPPK